MPRKKNCPNRGPHPGHNKNLVDGPDGMTYADHLRKALKRGTMNGGWTEKDLFDKSGQVKTKTLSKYDK